MTSSTLSAEALSLVHQGWSHLQLQRPLAAWASWQRALRVVPDDPAALQALETLANASELPVAARTVYRFRTPGTEERRVRWNARFQGRDLEHLDVAAAAFGALAADDPDDAEAAYNEGLCLAWLGRNAEAIGALDRAVRLLAAVDDEHVVEAWTLAEVLRRGEEAESLADDLRYIWIIDGADSDVVTRLSDRVTLVKIPTPHDPLTEDLHADAEVYEWLDRPMPASLTAQSSVVEIPRLLATLVRTPRSLRFSSPDLEALDAIQRPLEQVLGAQVDPIRREAMVLPLPLLDAAVWTFRLPRGLAAETEAQLMRQAVESHYENRWIHVPRKGLGGRSPRDAARHAASDAVTRAKLTAVVRLREQLGDRPRTAALYQGYPFDRLRRRLGLELVDPDTVDPQDVACMSESELDRLDPATLDDSRLAEAFESASGLRGDELTVRFAAELVRRESPALLRLDLVEVFAPLVRSAMAARRPERAIAWIERACAVGAGRFRRTFDVWNAEVCARIGDPDGAVKTYEDLLAQGPADAASLALDAAETLIDNGFEEHARPFLRQARDHARTAGDVGTEARARALAEGLLS